jgi:hypothetical protein
MNELHDILAAMLAKMPRVVVGKKMNSMNFSIGKKVFGFTKGDGVVLKLPPETVKRVVDTGTAALLVMGKRTMKEWVVIRHRNPNDFKKDLRLFKEAMVFVAGRRG